jgi:type II secretory pathway pseudopilin PulG
LLEEVGVREGGEPNTPLTALVGIVFAILLFVVVVLLQAFFYRAEQQENERKVVAVAPEQLSQLRAQQQELLHSYKLIDPGKGVVAIPVDLAMKLVVSEGGRSPWPAAQPPSTPAPAAKSAAPPKR